MVKYIFNFSTFHLSKVNAGCIMQATSAEGSIISIKGDCFAPCDQCFGLGTHSAIVCFA